MLCEKTCCAITDILQTRPFFSRNARFKFSNFSGQNIPVNAKKTRKFTLSSLICLVRVTGVEPAAS
nr:MAG TPA: hypothetical protein [Caudoviricetes sp.]